MKIRSPKKLKIGIDIDNVLTDSYRFVLERFNQNFSTSVSYEEVFDFYYLEKYAGIEISRAKLFIEEIIHSPDFHEKLLPYEDAAATINSWSKHGFFIFYITARNISARKLTLQWLKKHKLLVPGATLDLMDYEKYNEAGIFKKEIVERRKIDIMVEDSEEVAKELTIPVYMFNKPWNKGKLPKNVKRVDSWKEINKDISNMSSSRMRGS